MSSMTIPFSTSFVSIDWLFYMEAKVTAFTSYGGWIGTVNVGGTSSRTFAEDGDTSSLRPHPTSAFVSFAHLAHQ